MKRPIHRIEEDLTELGFGEEKGDVRAAGAGFNNRRSWAKSKTNRWVGDRNQ